MGHPLVSMETSLTLGVKTVKSGPLSERSQAWRKTSHSNGSGTNSQNALTKNKLPRS